MQTTNKGWILPARDTVIARLWYLKRCWIFPRQIDTISVNSSAYKLSKDRAQKIIQYLSATVKKNGEAAYCEAVELTVDETLALFFVFVPVTISFMKKFLE